MNTKTFWDGNAEAWTKLARAGYDVYRDFLNTPAFFAMLPEVSGLVGLDLGCGEGHNTRLLAGRGARMFAIDVSRVFLTHAAGSDRQGAARIGWCASRAGSLPFEAMTFHFATAFMSLMDFANPDDAVSEIFRVLKPGGFFQFSIAHPCFDTPHRRNLRDSSGRTYAIEVGDYYRDTGGEISEWLFSAAPEAAKAGLPKFRVPRFHRTLSGWINLLIDHGFAIERMEEPAPSAETVKACPAIQDAQVVSYFLHVRARKPAAHP